jgi:hypothetical protein
MGMAIQQLQPSIVVSNALLLFEVPVRRATRCSPYKININSMRSMVVIRVFDAGNSDRFVLRCIWSMSGQEGNSASKTRVKEPGGFFCVHPNFIPGKMIQNGL